MPTPGQAEVLARWAATARAAADLVKAGGLDLGSVGRLPLRQAPSLRGVRLSLRDQGAERLARTGHRGSLAPATAGRRLACPLADPQGRGTAPRSLVTLATRHRRRARSLAARRPDSSTASTRSSGTREPRPPVSPVLDQGSLEVRGRGTVPGSSVTVSRAKAAPAALAPAPPLAPVQAARQARASPGRGRRPGDRLATRRRPASSPARWDTDQVLLAAPTRRARTRPGPCRQASSPRASRQVRPGKRRPSQRAGRSPERRPPVSSRPAGQVRKHLARGRRDQAGGRPRPWDRPGQGRVARPTTIPTGC